MTSCNALFGGLELRALGFGLRGQCRHFIEALVVYHFPAYGAMSDDCITKYAMKWRWQTPMRLHQVPTCARGLTALIFFLGL